MSNRLTPLPLYCHPDERSEEGSAVAFRVSSKLPTTDLESLAITGLQTAIRSVLLRPMHSLRRWLRRIVMLFLCLIALGWLYEETTQWLIRWHGEQLLAEMKSLQVGGGSANLDTLVGAWSKDGTLDKSCYGENQNSCYYYIRFGRLLPSAIRADPEAPHKNWIAGLIDHIGLRNSMVAARVQTENGVIIEKSFSEVVELPVRDWYLRGGAYVPELAVSSGENTEFRAPYQSKHINPAHPFCYARRYKGPYGLGVAFTSNESAPEKEKLMDFRFSCITKFLPCRDEREILAEGARLLENER